MKRPLCVLCYIALGTLGAAVLSTVFATSAAAQTPQEICKMDEGTWKAELKMNIPGAGEMTMTGTEVNRMIGNWVISSFEGEFQGQAFMGHSTYGYDEEKKKIVSTWVDNMPQPGVPVRLAIMEGEYDKELKAIVAYMDAYDMQGNKVKEKHVSTNDGNGKRKVSMYQQSGDDWTLMMEITYTRVAGEAKATATVDK